MLDSTISNDLTMGGATGTLLAGRYRVVRQLGQGGMGSVWLAEDTKLDGFKVAIKMLPSVLVNNKRAYAQVKAEALVSLKLSHPNIVTVRAFEEEGGNPFLVMDYIDGQTLDDYLAEKGKLTEEETVKLLKPVAAALDYAHTQGVVHRDVKPGNVMIRKDGTPFVLDFGIAREIQETMTRVTGKLSSGTLLYMSPEQLHGAAPKPAQDIYSFAAMAYECLTGQPPFSRGQIEYQIEHDQPEPIGPQFANCGSGVMAGLAKSAEARPATCEVVLEGGSRCVASTAPVSKTRIVVVGALLALAAIVGVGGWLWLKKSKSDELAEERARQIEIATREAERQKAEAERIAADKVEAERKAKAEEERVAAEKRKAEEARIAAEVAAHKAKVDAERVAEEKRKADEMQFAAEKAEAALKTKLGANRSEKCEVACKDKLVGKWKVKLNVSTKMFINGSLGRVGSLPVEVCFLREFRADGSYGDELTKYGSTHGQWAVEGDQIRLYANVRASVVSSQQVSAPDVIEKIIWRGDNEFILRPNHKVLHRGDVWCGHTLTDAKCYYDAEGRWCMMIEWEVPGKLWGKDTFRCETVEAPTVYTRAVSSETM